jgi:DNA-binding transcriptional regulator YdaS (Cro superfamily)
MDDLHPVERAAKALNTSLEGLGKLLDVTKGAVSQWKLPGRQVPEKHCVVIERETKGAVTRKDLRPDDWHLIWPELIEKKPRCRDRRTGQEPGHVMPKKRATDQKVA